MKRWCGILSILIIFNLVFPSQSISNTYANEAAISNLLFQEEQVSAQHESEYPDIVNNDVKVADMNRYIIKYKSEAHKQANVSLLQRKRGQNSLTEFKHVSSIVAELSSSEYIKRQSGY